MKKIKDRNVYDFLQDRVFVRWCKDTSGEGEWQLENLLAQFPYKRAEIEEAKGLVRSLHYDDRFSEEELQELWSNIRAAESKGRLLPIERRRRLPSYYKYAAACMVLLAVAFMLYFGIQHAMRTPEKLIHIAVLKDLKPGGDRAVLMLADGREVPMTDSTWSGEDGGIGMHQQGHGELVYSAATGEAVQTAYHTLRTPKGGKFRLQLPDGTKVWLNAHSSLRFPVRPDAEKERVVQLEGEAYFEVAKLIDGNGKNIPFKVRVLGKRAESDALDDVTITVLGTHFNVSAYGDDEYVQTSLLEGSVRIEKGKSDALLKPGQQAILTRGSDAISVVSRSDLQHEIAWINGYFHFERTPLREIMEDMGRWYDARIVYKEEHLKEQVYSMYMMSNSVPASRILQLLELTGNVHFKLEDLTIETETGNVKRERRITVIP